jgi:hypothetical protein
VFVDLGINIVAAEKALYGTMITTRVAGLVAGGEGIVNISFDAVGLTPDGVHDRMAVAAKLGIFRFVTLDQVENFQRRMPLERLSKEIIQTLGATAAVDT